MHCYFQRSVYRNASIRIGLSWKRRRCPEWPCLWCYHCALWGTYELSQVFARENKTSASLNERELRIPYAIVLFHQPTFSVATSRKNTGCKIKRSCTANGLCPKIGALDKESNCTSVRILGPSLGTLVRVNRSRAVLPLSTIDSMKQSCPQQITKLGVRIAACPHVETFADFCVIGRTNCYESYICCIGILPHKDLSQKHF